LLTRIHVLYLACKSNPTAGRAPDLPPGTPRHCPEEGRAQGMEGGTGHVSTFAR